MKSSSSHINPPPASRQKSAVRWLLVLRRTILTTATILLIAIGLLHLGPVRDSVIRTALKSANPVTGSDLTVDIISGSVLHRLRLIGTRFISRSIEVRLDTIEIAYNPLSLLFSGRIQALRLNGFHVTAIHPDDGIWLTIDSTESDNTARDVRVDHMTLERGKGVFIPDAGRPDSTWILSHFAAAVRNLRIGDTLTGSLDTLTAEFIPGRDGNHVHFGASARVRTNEVENLELKLESASSRLLAVGSFILPDKFGSGMSGIDFSVEAPSLAARDLYPFATGLHPDLIASISGTVRGDSSGLTYTLSGRFDTESAPTNPGSTSVPAGPSTPGRGAAVVAEGSIRFEGDSIAVSTDASFHAIDLTDFLSASGISSGNLNGRVVAELSGKTLDQIEGSVDVDIRDSSVEDVPLGLLQFNQHFSNGTGSYRLNLEYGGSSIRSTGWIRPFDSEPAWKVRGDFRSVDLSRFPNSSAPPMSLSGSARSQRLADSTGTMVLLGDFQFQETVVGLCNLSQGRLVFEKMGSFWTADADAALCDSGRVSVRAESGQNGAYRVDGLLERVNAASLIEDSTFSSVSGDFAFTEAVGDDARSGTFFLRRIQYGAVRIDSISADLDLQGTVSHLRARVYAGKGRIEMNTTNTPSPSGIDIFIDRLRIDHVYPNDWISDVDVPVRIQASAVGRVLVSNGTLVSMDTDLDLSGTRIHEALLKTGVLQLSGDAGAIRFSAAGTFESDAGVDLRGSIDRLPAEPTFRDIVGSFENLNVGPLLGAETFTTSLSGSISAGGAASRGSLLVHVAEGSRVQDLILDSLRMESLWDPASIRTSLTALADSGLVELTALVRRTGLSESSADSLSGVVSARPAGDPITDLMEGPTGSEGTLSAGEIEAELTVQNWNIVAMSGLGDDLSDQSTPLPIGSSVDFHASFSGPYAGSRHVPYSLRIDSLSAAWGAFRLRNGHAKMSYRTGTGWSLSSFELPGSFGEISASGSYYSGDGRSAHPPSDLHVSATLGESSTLGPIADFLPASWSRIRGSAKVSGDSTRNRIEMNLDVSDLAAWESHVSESTLLVLVETEGAQISTAEVRAENDLVTVFDVNSETALVNAFFDGDIWTVQTDWTIDEMRRIEAAVSLIPGPDGGLSLSKDVHLSLTRFSAALGGEVWTLFAPARILIGRYPSVRGLILTSDSRRIIANSGMNRDEGATTSITIDRFGLDSVADLFGYPGLGGSISGVLTLTQSGDSFEATGTLEAGLTSFGLEAGVLEGQLMIQNGIAQVNATMTHTSGSEARFTGILPFGPGIEEPEFEPVRVTLTAESFPLAWTRPFIDPDLVDRLEGSLSADLRVGGTWGTPALSGSLSVNSGVVGIRFLGKPGRSLPYHDVSIQLELGADTVQVVSVTSRSGNGSITGHGTIAMRNLAVGDVDLDITASDFLAVDNEQYRTVVSGRMRLSGTSRAPVLNGNVRLVSADFYLTNETSADLFEPVSLSDRDISTIEKRFGLRLSESDTTSFDVYRSLGIGSLKVNLERDSWLRSRVNPRMDVQFTGDLDVIKESGSEAELFGRIRVAPERSRIVQFGRRFELESGTLTYNGSIENPNMDLQAQYRVPSRGSNESEVTIRLVAQGRPDEMTVSFSSDPPMELSDIVSYIATGRPASESLRIGSGKDGGYMRSAAGLAVGPITDLVENLASAGLGLDIIEIEQNGRQSVTLTAGKYVSPRLFVAVSQPISFSSGVDKSLSTEVSHTQVVLEYELIRQLLVRLLNRGTIFRVNLKWEHAF